MMRALRTISKILMAFPVITFFYDLVKEWFVNNRFKIRSLEQWWTWFDQDSFTQGKDWMIAALGNKWAEQILSWPAPLSLAILPVTLYLIYRIWFKIKGGQSTGAYIYKSRD